MLELSGKRLSGFAVHSLYTFIWNNARTRNLVKLSLNSNTKITGYLKAKPLSLRSNNNKCYLTVTPSGVFLRNLITTSDYLKQANVVRR